MCGRISLSLQSRHLKGMRLDDAAAQKNSFALSILLPVVRLVRKGKCSHYRQGDAMHVQPHLFFDGRYEEAVEFYLFATLRYGRRSLRRVMDGHRGAVSAGA